MVKKYFNIEIPILEINSTDVCTHEFHSTKIFTAVLYNGKRLETS